ncbi:MULTISPECIES: ABC transporter ATP-binding protein [unclassified Luteimonas]|uniref:ABC transporter ATP-binding protein n=1 Tax=unclassified Luteimonas TaxID=2629088 RepID=UPI0018F06F76|nr:MULTISPECIES: ABC transporter ATP-binding protein [unclassified Luteimonas]MBJ6978552.1 ABC transporter ATP-binding protein [Luteimonas sp. MC1895]MBJ6983449.1 ABC transporter ATP-binding protein [Luteimonas sp. MC1750]QQO06301.1 ABC transporter ATP-binding protein [Luteimonas sp. MC1750]
MSSEVVVRLRGIGKSFPMFDKPYQQLLHVLAPGARRVEHFHALRGVDLDIRRGEAIGVIGRNGSGKSTLLQIIAGILQPSTGELTVSARIAALLELGAGFNPEFTGRENVRMNASLLGLSQRQVDERMDRILAFAEIGGHVDQQVKTYSSGMFMRLAFAVAVHTDPDVLIVDEALSVGDIYFQRKCFKRIEEMRQQGCTLLFVTHAIESVLQLCDRGVVLDRGRLIYDGDAQSAVKQYLRVVFGDNPAVSGDAPDEAGPGTEADAATPPGDEAALEERDLQRFLEGGARDQFHTRPGYNRDETRLGDGRALTADCLVVGGHGHGPLVHGREPFRLLVRYHFREALDRLIFGVRVCTVTGSVLYSANTLVSTGELYACDAGTTAIGEFDLRCALLRGQYFVTVGVSRLDEDGVEIHAIDRRTDAIILTVAGEVRHAEGVADMEAVFTLGAATGGLRSMG